MMVCYLDGTYSQANVTGLTRYSDSFLAALDRHPEVVAGRLQGVIFGYRGAGQFRVKLRHLQTELVPISGRLHLYANALLSWPNLTRWFRGRPQLVHYHDVFRFTADVPGVKSVVTVHDVSSLTCPDMYSKRAAFLKRRALRRLERSSAALVTDSETTRDELLSISFIEPGRVKVVPLGVAPVFLERANPPFAAYAGLGARCYVLYVGAYHPRKNIESIIEAFAVWAPELPVDLALVGPRIRDSIYRYSGYLRLPPSLKSRVHFLGLASDDQLAGLYQNALCLLFPSWHEGFGLPVVEAMASGCPVICSTRGALPEVTSGAAVLVEPGEVESMADAVTRIYLEPDFAQHYRELGQKRACRFTWEAVADQMVSLFLDRVAEGSL